MKSVYSKGLLAAVIGAMLCSTVTSACPGHKHNGAGEKDAAKKEKQTEKPKQESDAKTTTPKTDDKTPTTK